MRRNAGFARQLRRYYAIYTLGFAVFVVLLAIGESLGLSQQLIGHWFLFVTIAIYATIGLLSRTSDDYITYSMILQGGKLEMWLTDEPTQWGASPASRPAGLTN